MISKYFLNVCVLRNAQGIPSAGSCACIIDLQKRDNLLSEILSFWIETTQKCEENVNTGADEHKLHSTIK